MITKVYKTVVTCPCGAEFSYYRLPGELGRSQSYCSKECKQKFLKARIKSRTLVDLFDVPQEWQSKLERRVVRLPRGKR